MLKYPQPCPSEKSQLLLFRAAWFIAASVPLLQPVWKGFHGCRPTASSQVFLSICCSLLLVSEFEHFTSGRN